MTAPHTCSDCKHAYLVSQEKRRYECRLNPPTALFAAPAIFPIVKSDCFCAQWKETK